MPISAILIVIALVLFGREIVQHYRQKQNSWNQGEYVLKDRGEDIIRHAPPPDPELGFTNLPSFNVSGKRASTNRMNTFRFCVEDESAARELALSKGLVEPLTVTRLPLDPALGQNEYGLTIPNGASRYDEDCFVNSCLAHDTTHVPPGFMAYVTRLGLQASWLCGREHIASDVFHSVNVREKAALYGYAVHCSMSKEVPGDMAASEMAETYYKFADEAAKDAKAYISISKRPGSDMWKPVKNTTAYAFASKFFSEQ